MTLSQSCFPLDRLLLSGEPVFTRLKVLTSGRQQRGRLPQDHNAICKVTDRVLIAMAARQQPRVQYGLTDKMKALQHTMTTMSHQYDPDLTSRRDDVHADKQSGSQQIVLVQD